MKNNKLLLLLFITFFACSISSYKDALAKVVKANIENLKDYDMIIVIPGSGCTGCITVAEKFFNENVNNDRYLFVFTNNISQKNIRLKLGKDNILKNNVIIDTTNKFYIDKFEESIYPLAMVLNRNEIINIYLLENIR